MGQPLKNLTLRGFKSINNLDKFDLGKINILIGANGSGKSNLIEFFRMIRAMANEGLQDFVREQGIGDVFFHLGPKFTSKISARLEFGENVYEFDLGPTADGTLRIIEERSHYTGGHGYGIMRPFGTGLLESNLKKLKDEPATFGTGRGVQHYILQAISGWMVYHFHDTSPLARVRRDQPFRDRDLLRPDASNLASFLAHLKDVHPDHYGNIVDVIRQIAPYFDDFLLKPENKGGEERIRLEWRQKGSDFPFQPSQLSDGTLRFICLATALLQPYQFRPSTIVIDEPELGLHPFAIAQLAEMIHSAAINTQVVVSTQSTLLVDQFEPEHLIVVNRHEAESTFSRLNTEELKDWLEDYTMGELWRKNVVRGGPDVH